MKNKVLLLFLWLLGVAGLALADSPPVEWEWGGVVTDGAGWNGLAPGDAIRGTLTFPGPSVNGNQSSDPSFAAFYFSSSIDAAGVSFAAPYLGGWVVGESGQESQELILTGDESTEARITYQFENSEPDMAPSYDDVKRLNDEAGSWAMQVGDRQYNGAILRIARVFGAPDGAGQGGDSAPVPEPSSFALLGSGLAALSLLRKRGHNAKL